MKKAIQKAIEGGWDPVDFTDMPIENRGLLFFDDFPADTKEDVDKDHVYFYDTEYPEEGYYASMLMELAVLDPQFWQALGKAEGWEKVGSAITFSAFFKGNTWKNCWHSFIDHLAEGGNVDEFFNKLLK